MIGILDRLRMLLGNPSGDSLVMFGLIMMAAVSAAILLIIIFGKK